MDGDAVEVVHPERADVTGRVRRPWRMRRRRLGVEHRVIDEQLAPSPEEVAKCLRSVLTLERVGLFDELPRQIAPLPAQLVAHPREFLLLRQVLLTGLEPLVVLHHLMGWHVILLLEPSRPDTSILVRRQRRGSNKVVANQRHFSSIVFDSCAAVSARGSSTSTVRCSVGFGVAVTRVTPPGEWKRCHVPCGTMTIIPALTA